MAIDVLDRISLTTILTYPTASFPSIQPPGGAFGGQRFRGDRQFGVGELRFHDSTLKWLILTYPALSLSCQLKWNPRPSSQVKYWWYLHGFGTPGDPGSISNEFNHLQLYSNYFKDVWVYPLDLPQPILPTPKGVGSASVSCRDPLRGHRRRKCSTNSIQRAAAARRKLTNTSQKASKSNQTKRLGFPKRP